VSTLDGGRRVGRYRIVRFLGAGAMGEVYLAEDPHIERRLAIKTVRLAGGRPQDIEDRKKRLLREARAAGRLLHPNVVTLFDTGEEDGLLYLAFEFVEGCDLATRLETGEPPTLREVLRIVRQVADALDYAHRQGIVHRDIKPSNILIDLAGHVKVADFGIAKVAGQNTELTVVGSVMGSPQYLSPEQIRGDELDGRSDIFSLGVVLYELLSGRRPFDGETITTLVYQILHKDASISELRAVPLRLEQLLHRMLAKDRGDRLATAGMVAEELAAIERELPEATLSAPAVPAAEVLDATRVLPSRSIAPGPVDPAGSGGAGGSAGGAATPPSGFATAPAVAAPGGQPGTAPATPAGMSVPPIPPAAPAAPAPSIAPAATVPATPPAAAAPAMATAPVRRSSSAKVWVALAAVLLVLCGALATGAFWFWQRYLRRASPEMSQLVQPGQPPAAPSSPAIRPPVATPLTPTAAGAGKGSAGSGTAAVSSGNAGGTASRPAGGQPTAPRQQPAPTSQAAPAASAAGSSATGGALPAGHAGAATPPLPSGAGRSSAPVVKPATAPTRAAPETGGETSGSGGAETGAAAENRPRPRPGKLPVGAAGTTGGVAGEAPTTAASGSVAYGASGTKSGASGSKNASGAGGSAAKGRAESTLADAGTSQPAAGERAAGASPAVSGAPASDAVDRVVHSGLELAFRVNPPDAFVLLDGAVIGRAQEWSGQQGGRSYTLPGTGPHLVKIKKPGMKDYRITVEASATRGTTPVVVSLQPLPTAQVETSDLQTVRVREAVALHVQPEVNALVLVDGVTVGPVKRFAGRFGHADEWLSLPVGMHRVTLVAPGYGRRDLAVEVSSGADKARQKVDIALSPATGSP
jgi:tRNA A-37 threonylcarbamoyl transferase component Bud32